MVDELDWLERAASLNQWRRGDERAPHKPLLFLYALARLQQGNDAPLRYREVEGDLDRLLGEFGPPRRSSPSYPFDHLASDGVWSVHSAEGRGSPGDSRRRLRTTDSEGELDPSLRAAIKKDPELLVRIARVLLDANFEPSVQVDLVEQIGIDLSDLSGQTEPASRRPSRDPRFRELVLIAYEYRCAMCGLDPQIDNVPVGVDAAHIRWWSAGGPDTLPNGLCLCSLHHKLFDRGVLGLDEERSILVSDRFRASGEVAEQLVLALSGRELAAPQRGREVPELEHIIWHRHEVFRGDPRAPAA